MDAAWNCPGYQAQISDRQCLINREVRRHWEPARPCRGCPRGERLAEAQPDLAAALAEQYGSPQKIDYFKTLRFGRFY